MNVNCFSRIFFRYFIEERSVLKIFLSTEIIMNFRNVFKKSYWFCLSLISSFCKRGKNPKKGSLEMSVSFSFIDFVRSDLWVLLFWLEVLTTILNPVPLLFYVSKTKQLCILSYSSFSSQHHELRIDSTSTILCRNKFVWDPIIKNLHVCREWQINRISSRLRCFCALPYFKEMTRGLECCA